MWIDIALQQVEAKGVSLTVPVAGSSLVHFFIAAATHYHLFSALLIYQAIEALSKIWCGVEWSLNGRQFRGMTNRRRHI